MLGLDSRPIATDESYSFGEGKFQPTKEVFGVFFL